MTGTYNYAPYYDDFDESKNFYKILFRPSYAVQNRELIQLQTILQNQITRFGNHTFKEGAMVIPGQVSYDNNYHYVKLDSIVGNFNASVVIPQLVGKVIYGQTSGVRALVQNYSKLEGSDPNTLFVKYLDSGTNNTTKVFVDGETLQPEDTAISSLLTKAIASGATGVGAAVSIQKGIYFIKGVFALVEEQSIILDKYTTDSSYRVGLNAVESIVTPDDDESLLDNSQGTYNYAAPGAHRYVITLTLEKRAIDSVLDENFIEILRVENGSIQYKVDKTDYSVLEETLARRTYDESGNYTVRPFGIDVREHRNNDRGQWASAKQYQAGDIVTNGSNTYVANNNSISGTTAPVHTSGTSSDSGVGGVSWTFTTNPQYNRGIYKPENGGDESKLAIGIEPSKAYIQGYEVEKIATEYITIPKSRDFVQVADVKINATVGNYVLVTNINNFPTIESIQTVDLYSYLTTSRGSAAGTKVGTARVRSFEYHSGTIGQTDCVFKMSLFDVKLNAGISFNDDVKQFYFNVGSAATNFTADIAPILQQISGSVTASASTTLVGTGTLFLQELKVGSYIKAGTSVRRVTAIASNISLTVDSNITVTGEALYKLSTTIYEPSNSGSIFPLPFYAIKSVRSSDNSIGTTYTVVERFVRTGSSVNQVTLSVAAAGDTFSSEAGVGNYLVTDLTTGDQIVPTSIVRLTSNTQLQLNFGSNVTNIAIIAAINRSGAATEKIKTLTETTVTLTAKNAATAKTISLGFADGYQLVSVRMDTGDFTTPTGTYSIDITDRYTFNDGQKDTHYDLASITLTDGEPVPSAPIRITFKYFSHSASGDYFTVNSYTSTIPYKDIPYYGDIALRDAIDFRPRISNDGTSFNGTGGSVSFSPKRGIDIEADFSYYLARKDKIGLDFKGNYFVVSGVPSLIPADPAEPATGMILYNVLYEPYTFGTENYNVIYTAVDNKRYTMRDIGKLEKRIANLEYYTSLSLLEQETKTLEIIDETGLDRFKNGFIVDSFNGHGIGNTGSLDYRCSIDMDNKTLRPFYSMKNVNLIEANSSDVERESDNYQITGDLITLPYTNQEFIKQPYASRTENVNPFAIFTFLGTVELNPSSDEWFEVNRLPDIVTNVEGNYNAIYTIAEQAGVLGTIWNAWQTEWTGVPTYAGTKTVTAVLQNGVGTNFDQLYGVAARRDTAARKSNVGIRKVTLEMYATEVGQSRTGLATSVVEKIDTVVTDDRTLSTAIIPYIRSRNILFFTRGLKPNTTFYPFFDSVDIKDYVTPATRIPFTAITNFSSEFNYTTNVGSVADETYRKINGASEAALNRGDVVFVQQRGATTYTVDTSPAKAVVVLQENSLDSGNKAIYVLNVNGTFLDDDIISGTITGARVTVSSNVTNLVAGDDIVSNFNGDVVGLFNIPNTDAIRFRTGVREFKLSDSSTGGANFTSQARKQYRAEGVLQTKQASVTATRNGEIVSNNVSETQTAIQTTSRVIADTGWYDPLAQTFLVQQTGGAFLTKVDVFFRTKDQNIPVQLEIREVVNGYPGKVVLPFSRTVLTPDKVSVSEDASVATSFVFASPVYLNDTTEYCLVLLSDSNNYNVWISQLGEKEISSDRYISEQPYAGVLFKSQNASTWTADQYQDLKFTIHRAKFDTSNYGVVEFVNDEIKPVALVNDALQTVAGSNKIRVYQPNHNIPSGSSVVLSGLTAAVNGIPFAEINGTHVVSNVEFDSYVITSTTNATKSGYGGTGIYASENVQFDSLQPIVQLQNFTDTTADFSIKTMSGKSISGVEVPNVIDTSYSAVSANDNNYFNSPRMILSSVNEGLFNSGNKSFSMIANLKTSNDSVSPVIDTHRLSLVTVNNKIDFLTVSDQVAALDNRTVVTAVTTIDTAGSVLSTSDSTIKAALNTLSIGKSIDITGFVSPNTAYNKTYLIVGKAADGSSVTLDQALPTLTGPTLTIVVKDHFIDEIAPVGGSAYSKYITRRINLNNPSTFLNIRLSANVSPFSDLSVYIKTNTVGSSDDFDSIKYTLVQPDAAITKTDGSTFYDVQYSLDNLSAFDAVQVKLVLRSVSTSNVPLVKELRVIACA